ncbi:MAG: hypothetical protein SXG53_17620 [Pseudomonadota bacterium]|nr:hypothetical protein [Pseudomonadota bacterium]
MDERLRKQWDVTRSLLQSATSELASGAHQREVADFIADNQFERAIDALDHAASHQQVSAEFWWRLAKAAEAMGLAERRQSLLAKCPERRRR